MRRIKGRGRGKGKGKGKGKGPGSWLRLRMFSGAERLRHVGSGLALAGALDTIDMSLVDHLPFARANLRWNPFGEVPEAERGALTVPCFDVDAEVHALASPGHAVELVGDCGRGKSMHLLALHDHFSDSPMTRVDPGERPSIPRADVVFVDESQRLSRAVRRRLFSRRASFVLATHESHAEELREAGVACRSFAVARTDVTHLRAIVQRRIEWARRGPGALPSVPTTLLEELSKRFADDLRGIEGALYTHFQRSHRGQL